MLIDFSKAFDSLHLDILFETLNSLGVNGKLLRVIHNYLSTRKVVVHNGDTISPSFSAWIGSSISSDLFNCYINNIFSQILTHTIESKILIWAIIILIFFYADDTVLFHHNHEQLQKLLNFLENICLRINLNINPKKTVFGFIHYNQQIKQQAIQHSL